MKFRPGSEQGAGRKADRGAESLRRPRPVEAQ